jgi:hypothetical protein
MSCILYYSKYCEVSKKYLQLLSKSDIQKDIHFICIDKRIKDSNNKTYIILENGQKIILPENITKVPALLLLNQGYQVLYGEQILQHLKPRQQQEIKQATQNNMEPMAFSLGGGGGNFGNIVSDQYSFLDQDADDLKAEGNGGMRQMHNYVDLNTAFSGNVSNVPTNDDFNTTIRGAQKMGEDASNMQMESKLKQMQEQRDADIRAITGNRPPMSF